MELGDVLKIYDDIEDLNNKLDRFLIQNKDSVEEIRKKNTSVDDEPQQEI